MKAKLDFENKTIELECQPTLKEVQMFQQHIQNWQEWRIIAPVLTVTNPIWWPEPYPTWPYSPPIVTYTNTDSTAKDGLL